MTGRDDPKVGDVVAAALISGPASRTDLLAAAVAARAPTEVLESILRLPERCYRDADDLRSALDARQTFPRA
jgi:Protein of unknown function (DUF2795)